MFRLLFLDEIFCIYLKVIWHITSFKASIFLLAFCLDDVKFPDKNGELNFPAITVLLSVFTVVY